MSVQAEERDQKIQLIRGVVKNTLLDDGALREVLLPLCAALPENDALSQLINCEAPLERHAVEARLQALLDQDASLIDTFYPPFLRAHQQLSERFLRCFQEHFLHCLEAHCEPEWRELSEAARANKEPHLAALSRLALKTFGFHELHEAWSTFSAVAQTLPAALQWREAFLNLTRSPEFTKALGESIDHLDLTYSLKILLKNQLAACSPDGILNVGAYTNALLAHAGHPSRAGLLRHVIRVRFLAGLDNASLLASLLKQHARLPESVVNQAIAARTTADRTTWINQLMAHQPGKTPRYRLKALQYAYALWVEAESNPDPALGLALRKALFSMSLKRLASRLEQWGDVPFFHPRRIWEWIKSVFRAIRDYFYPEKEERPDPQTRLVEAGKERVVEAKTAYPAINGLLERIENQGALSMAAYFEAIGEALDGAFSLNASQELRDFLLKKIGLFLRRCPVHFDELSELERVQWSRLAYAATGNEALMTRCLGHLPEFPVFKWALKDLLNGKEGMEARRVAKESQDSYLQAYRARKLEWKPDEKTKTASSSVEETSLVVSHPLECHAHALDALLSHAKNESGLVEDPLTRCFLTEDWPDTKDFRRCAPVVLLSLVSKDNIMRPYYLQLMGSLIGLYSSAFKKEALFSLSPEAGKAGECIATLTGAHYVAAGAELAFITVKSSAEKIKEHSGFIDPRKALEGLAGHEVAFFNDVVLALLGIFYDKFYQQALLVSKEAVSNAQLAAWIENSAKSFAKRVIDAFWDSAKKGEIETNTLENRLSSFVRAVINHPDSLEEIEKAGFLFYQSREKAFYHPPQEGGYCLIYSDILTKVLPLPLGVEGRSENQLMTSAGVSGWAFSKVLVLTENLGHYGFMRMLNTRSSFLTLEGNTMPLPKEAQAAMEDLYRLASQLQQMQHLENKELVMSMCRIAASSLQNAQVTLAKQFTEIEKRQAELEKTQADLGKTAAKSDEIKKANTELAEAKQRINELEQKINQEVEKAKQRDAEAKREAAEAKREAAEAKREAAENAATLKSVMQVVQDLVSTGNHSGAAVPTSPPATAPTSPISTPKVSPTNTPKTTPVGSPEEIKKVGSNERDADSDEISLPDSDSSGENSFFDNSSDEEINSGEKSPPLPSTSPVLERAKGEAVLPELKPDLKPKSAHLVSVSN